MLGTGIKNGILFVLIILILHFLIKNMLLEKTVPIEFMRDETSDIPEKKIVSEIAKNKNSKTMEENKQDLYKYVMEDSEMEKFFEPQLLPEANDKFDNNYPVACDAKIIMDDEAVKTEKKTLTKPEQINNNFLVIHDYKDESSLNGGKLYDGLNGYDEYDNMYEEYRCN